VRSAEPKYSSIMRNVGKTIRAGNLLSDDGRTLIVAMDHGMIGITKGIEFMERVVESSIKGGADAVLITLGAAKRLAQKISGKLSMVLSIPFDPKYVELAAKIGADAVKTTYFGKVPLAWSDMARISSVAEAAEDWGVIYITEIVPMDEAGKTIYDLEVVKQAARIGSELGGDFVKTAYVGPASSYKAVVEASLTPIIVMGGPKMESPRDVLTMVKESLEAGAIGGAIGRNIWQYKDPEKMTKALAGIIHEDLSVEKALRLLEQ